MKREFKLTLNGVDIAGLYSDDNNLPACSFQEVEQVEAFCRYLLDIIEDIRSGKAIKRKVEVDLDHPASKIVQ